VRLCLVLHCLGGGGGGGGGSPLALAPRGIAGYALCVVCRGQERREERIRLSYRCPRIINVNGKCCCATCVQFWGVVVIVVIVVVVVVLEVGGVQFSLNVTRARSAPLPRDRGAVRSPHPVR